MLNNKVVVLVVLGIFLTGLVACLIGSYWQERFGLDLSLPAIEFASQTHDNLRQDSFTHQPESPEQVSQSTDPSEGKFIENNNFIQEEAQEITTQPTQPVKFIHYQVPFTAQAPFGEWDDPLQQDGCEEASALMAVMWARDELKLDLTTAKNTIIEAGLWQKEHYGVAQDTSAVDTVERIFQGFFEFKQAQAKEVTDSDAIIQVLMVGKLVVAPMDGQKLNNPNFTYPGPERHMLVIIGYDPNTEQFITNDPGTRRGQDYRYHKDVLWQALRDYPTGNQEPIKKEAKMIIEVEKLD